MAGVIVNPDRQWRQLENYFRDLFNASFPEREGDIDNFVFHAKDIWHGSGAFDRKVWTRKDRLKLLVQLAQVPRLFELPIVVGAYDRQEAQAGIQAKSPKVDAKGAHYFTHMNAFVLAVQGVEYWMARNAPEEVAMLIAEDTPVIKSILKNVHQGYTSRMYEGHEEAFNAPHVIDTVHFAMKQESILLQIADHCAFIIKRHLMGKTDTRELYDLLAPNIQKEYTKATGIIFRVIADQISLVK